MIVYSDYSPPVGDAVALDGKLVAITEASLHHLALNAMALAGAMCPAEPAKAKHVFGARKSDLTSA